MKDIALFFIKNTHFPPCSQGEERNISFPFEVTKKGGFVKA